MGHTHDFWEPLRRIIIPKIGAIVQLYNDITGSAYYAETKTHGNQFVGRVAMSEDEFEKVLHDGGYERNPLSSWKRLATTDEEMEGSWRKVLDDDFQIHVVLYDGSKIHNANTGYTYIYAHKEYRWDVHPVKHYNGVKFNAGDGVRKVKDFLDQRGIPYDLYRP